MFRYLVIGLATAGMFGLLALAGWLQGAAFHAAGFGVSWAMLSCGFFAVVSWLTVK